MDNKKENDQVLSNSHLGSRKMSSSLKEKLRRSSRAFSNPVSQFSTVSSPHSNVQNSTSFNLMKQFSLEDIESCMDQEQLYAMNCNLKSQILDNEEKLRKLELVQHYNIKNKPDDLTSLIQKWLTTSQEALQRLYEKLPENKTDLPGLLKTLNIDYNIIQYDPDSDTFN